jgi:hypothetical protein
MALQFVKYERQAQASLGTIAEIVGAGGSYRPASMSNWTSSKRVALVLQNKAGESCLVVCSPQVSEKLRSKELRLSHLQNFEVREFITNSGELVNTVVMPSAESGVLPTVVVGQQAAPAFQPTKQFNLEELIAF